jgi:phosphoglycerate kinase
MEELHREKARSKELLKCCKVRLKQEDLAQVEEDLDGGKLEHIPGFFLRRS